MIDMNKTMSQFASTDDYYKSIIEELKAAPICQFAEQLECFVANKSPETGQD